MTFPISRTNTCGITDFIQATFGNAKPNFEYSKLDFEHV
jgi:hypothetical protein